MTSPVKGSPDTGEIRDLFSSISTSITKVHYLPSRWSAMSITVERLRSIYDDLIVTAGGSNALAIELLQSLAVQLKSVLSLANACSVPGEPPAGKLRTQSDIAATAAALENLAKDAELLIRSGVLLEPPRSISSSGCGGGATREIVRSEIRSLVIKLQLNTPSAARTDALDSLLDLLNAGDDKIALIAAAQGASSALTRLLSDGFVVVKEKAAAALARLTAVDGCRNMLISEGTPLVLQLSRAVESSGAVNACAALVPLTRSRDNAAVAGSRGMIAALLNLIRSGSGGGSLATAAVLSNISAFPELHSNLIEENSIQVLIGALLSVNTQIQELILGCLRNLAAANNENVLNVKISMVQLGVLDCLKSYFNAVSRNESCNLEPGLGLLGLLSEFEYVADLALGAGFVPVVVAALSSSSSGTRIEAAGAVRALSISSKVNKVFAECGCIAKLVLMLEAKLPVEKEAAAWALACLVESHECRRVFRKEEKGVWNVVQLIDPLTKNVDRKYAIAILAAVLQSRRCRKQMVAAGACSYLQKLADLQVEGAKKLLDTLTRGKLWGLFRRS